MENVIGPVDYMTFKSFLVVNFSNCLKEEGRHQVQKKKKDENRSSTFKYMCFSAHIVPEGCLPFGKMCLFPPLHTDKSIGLEIKAEREVGKEGSA